MAQPVLGDDEDCVLALDRLGAEVEAYAMLLRRVGALAVAHDCENNHGLAHFLLGEVRSWRRTAVLVVACACLVALVRTILRDRGGDKPKFN